ncbi:glycosyltransferase family 4 protein [Botrimarina hoheduenensis]|uniref:2-deoxystreptamine glucosyltransferase n=1 Tax=Botrimarina hoheduenensis TaxID=2528000 RepID=A0A5C5VZT0_9BACT|nr:glycosyltransferase family 4 protein [Botrimarina hoheduenensis]TWT43301.1 2-deoxystreptamine glucosyltransferase [Botrimarina hoheduenensis]
MRIAYLAAGAGGMYCGSCLHDNTLAAALLERGEDVTLIPTYTPLRTDERSVARRRVFFGGVNAYLLQESAWYRRVPRWLRHLLDTPSLLRLATRGAGSVDPAQLGPLTVSTLEGLAGNQRDQLAELADWLATEIRPEIVHLSNSMLLGMAQPIAAACNCPVVCNLSGEDLFLEGLAPPYHDQALTLLRANAQHVTAFTALNTYYADFMADYLRVERDRVHVVPHGLRLDEAVAVRDAEPASPTPIIGYLARICEDKGLHLLVEAGMLLAERLPDLPFEIQAAGYLGAADCGYLIDLHRRVDRSPLAGRFRYRGELTRDKKFAFLRSLAVFSTPTVYAEAKGLPALEALAVGVPVVLPDHGAFPELIRATGGGLLHPPRDATALSATLEALLEDADNRQSLGQAGAAATRERYYADRMAQETLAVYQHILGD